MKNMKIKIIQMPSERRVIEVAAIAKTSYHCEDYEYFEKSLTYEEAVKFIKTLIKNGHHSALEPLQIEFNLTGISRVLSHQQVRNRIGFSYMQKSLRRRRIIVIEDLIYPETSKNADIYEAAMKDSIGWYELLLERDEPPDDARRVLPIGVATELTVTCNVRSLRKFLSERLSKKAGWEIRRLAMVLADAMAEEELGFLIEDIVWKFDKDW
jgi:thymidylate synthase (FAD)